MNLFEETSNWIRNSITLKLFLIGILVLILLIPSFMIQNLILERSLSQLTVVEDITGKWGKEQLISGPVLTLPYRRIIEQDGKKTETVEYAHFLPDKLDISGVISPSERSRNIYRVMLYNSTLRLSGNFLKPDLKQLNLNENEVLWEEAIITIGIPDMRGIRKAIILNWNDSAYTGNPGVLNKDIIESGINCRIAVNPSTGLYKFSVDLDVNGSKKLSFLPLGKETHVALKSSWNSPSFSGAFLPEKKTVNESGFTAAWNVLHLNRNYPQQWAGMQKQSVEESAFGVDMLFPVDHYQKSTRSAKYAVMFLFLTFLVFFVNEVISKTRVHPIQYLMIGLALIIFYTLLISISEYIGFNWAYLISALLTISLITTYAASILTKKGGVYTGIILLMLYGFLFVLLQLEDYSLMIGSIGLFVILAMAMLASRKINWYSPLKGDA